MEVLQQRLDLAEQERDQATTDRAIAQAAAAQAVQDLLIAQAAPGGGGQVSFALLPALASATILNYKTSEGIKIYGKATAPLDVLFDGDSGALRLFLSKVQQRAMQSGWLTILWITQGTQVFNFVHCYGQVTIEAIQAQAMSVEAANGSNTQNTSQMYTFLITSISDGLLGKGHFTEGIV